MDNISIIVLLLAVAAKKGEAFITLTHRQQKCMVILVIPWSSALLYFWQKFAKNHRNHPVETPRKGGGILITGTLPSD